MPTDAFGRMPDAARKMRALPNEWNSVGLRHFYTVKAADKCHHPDYGATIFAIAREDGCV